MSAAYLKVRAPNYEHKKGCTGKHAYVSLADARNNCVVKRQKHDIYLCEHCAHWHTQGNKERSRNR